MPDNEAARKAAEKIHEVINFPLKVDVEIVASIIAAAIASETAEAINRGQDYQEKWHEAEKRLLEVTQRADRAEAALKILSNDYPKRVAIAIAAAEATKEKP